MGCCGSTPQDEKFADITTTNNSADGEPADEAKRQKSRLSKVLTRIRPKKRRNKKKKKTFSKRQITRSRENAVKHGCFEKTEHEEVYEPEKWSFDEVLFAGRSTSLERAEEEVKGPIAAGIAKLKEEPEKYLAITYQSSMLKWPEKKQKYTLLLRAKTKGYRPEGVTTDPVAGWMTLITANYLELPRVEDVEHDQHTDKMMYRGEVLHHPANRALKPGRGDGVCDMPGVKIIGDVDPSDIHQGYVGDCWLLSGISSLAEFEGAIHRLFRHTDGLEYMPRDTPNTYTVTLWDLPTMKEVDVVIDERLARKADGSGLLGCQPSSDGELWVCYLEKALAVHCGGWDKINGGHCTHAWALLTGCRMQLTIKRSKKSNKFKCWGTYNPNEDRWEQLANSPKDGFRGLWPMAWPDVGGSGPIGSEIDEEELFMKMCAWDDQNYIMGAGTRAGSDENKTDGLVDGHAYSVIECVNDVAGTQFDLIKMRNPWGAGGELENNYWGDHGKGWEDHPEITAALKPTHADDGIFWVEKHRFFTYYHTIYVSCSDMSHFLEDDEEEEDDEPAGGEGAAGSASAYGSNY